MNRTDADAALDALRRAIADHTRARNGPRPGALLATWLVVEHWVEADGDDVYVLTKEPGTSRHVMEGLLAVGGQVLRWPDDDDVE